MRSLHQPKPPPPPATPAAPAAPAAPVADTVASSLGTASSVPLPSGEGITALRQAWAFLWDPAEPSLRARIGAAFVLMIGAKLVTIQVPFLFKYAVDSLSDPAAPEVALVAACGLTPATLLLAYGGTRLCAEGMAQARNALFARVTEGALRRMARRTFAHLMGMELRFHLDRQTGALTRVVERGTRAVGALLSTSVLQVLPLAFEVSVVSALLYRHCGAPLAAVTLTTLCLYAAFTFSVTQARTAVRRAQNAADAKASQRFTDSLINYETVKYFDTTAHEEARRHRHSLARRVRLTRLLLTQDVRAAACAGALRLGTRGVPEVCDYDSAHARRVRCALSSCPRRTAHAARARPDALDSARSRCEGLARVIAWHDDRGVCVRVRVRVRVRALWGRPRGARTASILGSRPSSPSAWASR